MPCDEAFWGAYLSKQQKQVKLSELAQIKGFIVALPTKWLKDQNNRISEKHSNSDLPSEVAQ
jgi:hypothetical protein